MRHGRLMGLRCGSGRAEGAEEALEVRLLLLLGVGRGREELRQLRRARGGGRRTSWEERYSACGCPDTGARALRSPGAAQQERKAVFLIRTFVFILTKNGSIPMVMGCRPGNGERSAHASSTACGAEIAASGRLHTWRPERWFGASASGVGAERSRRGGREAVGGNAPQCRG